MPSWFKNWNPTNFIIFSLFFNFIYSVIIIIISWKIFFLFDFFQDGIYFYAYMLTYIAIYVGLVYYQSYNIIKRNCI
jgi:hypothetical protein